MKKRNEVIDVARGILLILVILGHLVKVNSIIFNWIFTFHMPMFFFLSGMCFNIDKYKNFYVFLKEKVKKRLIPYFSFILLGVILCLIIPSWRINLFNYQTIKEIFYYTQPENIHVGQLWFLVALFFAEIILYLVNKFFEKFKRDKYLIITTYLLLAITGGKIFNIINIFNFTRLPFKIDTAITACVFMGIGYEVNKNNIFEKIIKYKNFTIPISLLLGLFMGIYNGYVNICNCIYNNILIYYMAAVSGIIGIYFISDNIKENKIFKFYGTNTLVIFSIHSLLLILVTNIFSFLHNTKYVIMQNIPILLCIVEAIIIAILSVPIVEVYNKIKKKKV